MKKPDAAVRQLLRIEELAAKDTFVHSLHPGVKLLATLVYVICVVSVKNSDLFLMCIYFIYPALMLPLCELPLKEVIKRILPALPFVFFAGLSNIIFDRQPMLTVGSLIVSSGVVTCIALVFKTALTISSVIILSATTRSSDIFSQLRRMHVPAVLVTVIMLCFRYLSLLMTEAATMRNAYLLRAHGKKGVDIRDSGRFLGSLLVRCYDKAGRIYQSMLLRGYDGGYIAGKSRLRAADIAYCAVLCAAFITARIFL